MSEADSEATGGSGDPTPDQLRAAYEQQLKQLRVEDLLLDDVVTLMNMGMRRTGLSPGTEDERDPAQVRVVIESIRALLPVLEQFRPTDAGPDYLRPIRDALSQLQMAFVKIGGQAAAPTPDAPPDEAAASSPPKPDEPGPAQRSGRLWVPGQ